MIEVSERIFVAGDYVCPGGGSNSGFETAGRGLLAEHGEDWAIVHACKSPCHQRAVGYRGNLDKAHPNYLVLEDENNLYLNMIDPPVPLFKPELFFAALAFADREWSDGKAILFHCNQGLSRAPSLALLFLAKVQQVLSDDSYEAARRDFEMLYEFYAPGKGIESYLADNWSSLGVHDA